MRKWMVVIAAVVLAIVLWSVACPMWRAHHSPMTPAYFRRMFLVQDLKAAILGDPNTVSDIKEIEEPSMQGKVSHLLRASDTVRPAVKKDVIIYNVAFRDKKSDWVVIVWGSGSLLTRHKVYTLWRDGDITIDDSVDRLLVGHEKATLRYYTSTH